MTINIIRRDLCAIGFNGLEDDILKVDRLEQVADLCVYWTRSPYNRAEFSTIDLANSVVKHFGLRDCAVASFTNEPK